MATIKMKNMTDVPVNAVIYDLICRRDQPSSAGNATSPVTRWQNGVEFQRAPAQQGINPKANEFVGATPFQSPDFVQHWRVKSTRKVTLTAGTEHAHYVNIRPRNVFTSSLAPDSLLHGLTYCCMIVLYGDLTNEKVTTDFNLASKICTSRADLDVMTRVRYKLHEVEKNIVSYSKFDQQPRGLLTNGPVTMQPETAAEVNVDYA
jgi:hypothetical protein